MKQNIDPMEVMRDAARAGKDIMTGTVRRIRAEAILSPGDPSQSKMSDDEFLGHYDAYMNDENERSSRFASALARRPGAAGKIPVDLVEFGREGHRLAQKRQRQRFDTVMTEAEAEIE